MYKNIDFLSQGLSGAWRKNSAIASNLANANTPGYKRVTVDFQSLLLEQLQLQTMSHTDPKHYKSVPRRSGEINGRDGKSIRVDRNAVDIEIENAESAKNQIYFNVLTGQVNAQFSRIKSALKINK